MDLKYIYLLLITYAPNTLKIPSAISLFVTTIIRYLNANPNLKNFILCFIGLAAIGLALPSNDFEGLCESPTENFYPEPVESKNKKFEIPEDPLTRALKAQQAWFDYVKDHPLEAAIIITTVGIILYLSGDLPSSSYLRYFRFGQNPQDGSNND